MGGIFADPWKFRDFTDLSWKPAAMSIYDELCGYAEISGARVVAQPLPRVKHLRFRGSSERGERRKPAQPLFIIGQHRRDLRLLKHKLGNENAVRVARSAPRKIAAVCAVPMHESGSKVSGFFWAHDGANVQRSTLNVQFRVER